jgi:glutamyl-tRNA synthetase
MHDFYPMDRKFMRTRFAPTPSGYLHLGNVLSFAITTAIAQQTGAKILLRIDDLDRDRLDKQYVQDIFDTLNFLEIGYDEGPRNMAEYETQFSQIHRLGLYNQALERLKESGELFACACSRTDILRSGAEGIYPGTCRENKITDDAPGSNRRLRTQANKKIGVHTLNGITARSLPQQMKDFIVRKKDKYPAYQLTSVVDDIHFGIDLVVRGDDLWPSTIAQLYLANLLPDNSFADTVFHHHILLQENNGRKLSKSAGDTSVQYMRKQHKKIRTTDAKLARTDGADRH